jgi:hypothetical protein
MAFRPAPNLPERGWNRSRPAVPDWSPALSHSHGISGADLLGKPNALAPSPHKHHDVLVHKPGGSAGRRKHADTDSQSQEDQGPEPIKEEKVAKQEPTVTLTHPKWEAAQGHFDEAIVVSVEGRPPADNHDLTKVEFTAYLMHPNGKKDDKPLARGEGHLKDGKAEGEIILPWPEVKPGEKTPEHYHAVFTAKHSRSKPVDSAKIEVKEGPEFEGAIFYSPTRKEYFVLENADEAKEWLKTVAEMDEIREKAEKLRLEAESEKKKKEEDELDAKIERVFGKKAIGKAAVVDELVKLRWNDAYGSCKTWNYVPKTARTVSDPDKWKKIEDRKYKKPLEKEAKKASEGKGSKDDNKKSLVSSKLKYQLLKAGGKQGEWPWKWVDDEHDNGSSDHFSWSHQATICRWYVGWDGAEATLDLKAKKIALGASGSASYGLFEGQAKGEYHFPDKDGMDLLHYARQSGTLGHAIAAGKQCRLKLKLSLNGSIFVGASVSAALSFPKVDFGKKEAGAEATIAAFIGAEAGGKAKLTLEWWNGVGEMRFDALGEFTGGASAAAGAGAEFQWKLEYKNGKFVFSMSAKAVLGLGGKGSFSLDLDFKAGKDMALHLLHSVDYHYLEEITEEAYDVLTHYGFAKMVQAGHWIDEQADHAMGLVADFDAWLGSHQGEIKRPKQNLTEAAAQRSSLRYATPEAIGQGLITIMQTREETDFKSIMWMLYSSDSTHKLEWILRIVSQDRRKGTGVAEIKHIQSESLKAGIERIRAFGRGSTPHSVNQAFLSEFQSLLNSKGIIA